jgi:hydroxyacylglutathione hydrolase
MFQRFFEEGPAQSAFLIACDRTRRAAVIDPRRDAGVYVDAAREFGFTVTHAIETHTGAQEITISPDLP